MLNSGSYSHLEVNELSQTHTPKTKVMDGDGDGVIDQLDDCPTTQINVAVNNSGCALFSGVIEGVNFHSSSAKLTDESIEILSSVAQTLQAYPLVKFTLTAHTDS